MPHGRYGARRRPLDLRNLLRRPLLARPQGLSGRSRPPRPRRRVHRPLRRREPGSPWSFVVHVDERGSEEQREALAAILTGRLGGDDVIRLPWVRKPSNELAVRVSPIEIRHGADGHELRIGSAIELSATQAFETDERVACGIPGYHIAGVEYYADRLSVRDEPFEWELVGNCAFVSTFSYSG